MKKIIVLTVTAVILAVFVIPFVSGLFIKMIPNGDQPGYNFNNKRGIYGDFRVTQEFTSLDSNLAAIGTSLGNPNLKNQKEVNFELTDKSGNLVREVKVSGVNIPDGSFFRFVFDPIENSSNVKYYFTISSPTAGPEELINIFFSTEKTKWIGPASYGLEINENGLPIVAYYKPDSRLRIAKDIYTSWLKRVF